MNKIKIVLLLTFFFAPFLTLAYDDKIAHPGLTGVAIVFYNSKYENTLTPEQGTWISEGSIEEDKDPRYINHFYNPETGKGLNNLILSGRSTKEWARNQNGAGQYDYDEGTIIEAYRNKDYKRAFQGIGHILHLVQDMGVPAHTRNDAHPFGDPYEAWVGKNGKVYASEARPRKIDSLGQAFDELASYTHYNFFSKDTIEKDQIKDCEIKREKIDIKKVGDYVYCDSYKIIKVQIKRTGNKYSIDDRVNQEYWSLLYPQALEYNVAVLDFFMKKFKEIDDNREIEKIGFIKHWWQKRFGNKDEDKKLFSFEDIIVNGEKKLDGGKKSNFGVVTWGAEREENINNPNMVFARGKRDYAILDEDGVYVMASNWQDPEKKRLFMARSDLMTKTRDMLYGEDKKVLGIFETVDPPVDEQDPSTPSTSSGQEEQGVKDEEVEIKYVIDGDTIDLENGDRVRYVGINTPELKGAGSEDDECLAWVARSRNMALLGMGDVELVRDENMDIDKYGRLLRYVYAGDMFVNEVLVREGLAEPFFCKVGWENCPLVSDEQRKQEILEANIEARENKRGIYSEVCLEQEEREEQDRQEEQEQNKQEEHNPPAGGEQGEVSDLSGNTREPLPYFTSQVPMNNNEQEEQEEEEHNPPAGGEQVASTSSTSTPELGDEPEQATTSPATSTPEVEETLEIDIVSFPPLISTTSEAIFELSIVGLYDELVCLLNTEELDECATTTVLKGLSSGNYNFYVEASQGSTTASTSYAWQIDLPIVITDYVVINEIKLAGETTKDEFIELYNPTDENINLENYRLSRKTKSGSEYNLLTTFSNVDLPAGEYYLVAHDDYVGGYTPDAYYSTSQSIAKDNTIILYSDQGETIVDLVGLGEAGEFEGEPTQNPESGESVERLSQASSTIDTDINNDDFGLNSTSSPVSLAGLVETGGVVHLWYFDEGEGFAARDSEGDDDIMLEDDSGWTVSDWGPMISLQLADEMIDVELSQPVSGDMSISFWYYYNAGEECDEECDDEESQYFGDVLSFEGEEYGLSLEIYKNNSGLVFLGEGEVSFDHDFDDFPGWHYLALVYDHDNLTLSLFSENGQVTSTSLEEDFGGLLDLSLFSDNSIFQIYKLKIEDKLITFDQFIEAQEDDIYEIEEFRENFEDPIFME